MYKQVLDHHAKEVFGRLRDTEKKTTYWKDRALKAEKNLRIFSAPTVEVEDFINNPNES